MIIIPENSKKPQKFSKKNPKFARKIPQKLAGSLRSPARGGSAGREARGYLPKKISQGVFWL